MKSKGMADINTIYQQLSSHRAYIFACTRNSQEECFERMLFGTNIIYEDKILQVKIGDILFLFNMDTDILYGIFAAKSEGRKNIVPEAWKGQYPYQVEIEKVGDVKSVENVKKIFSKNSIDWRKVLDRNKTRLLLSSFGVNDSWGGLIAEGNLEEEIQEKPQSAISQIYSLAELTTFSM